MIQQSIRRTATRLLVSAAVMVTLGASVAQASSPDRTRGAAEAVLQAGLTGGGEIFVRHADAHGVPAGFSVTGDQNDIRVYPFAENASYCASGWHVINYYFGDALEFWDSKQAMFEWLASVDIVYELDASQIATRRTAIKPMPTSSQIFGFDNAYWFGVGALLPPGTLTEGTHGLTTTIIDPVFGNLVETVSFRILPC